MDLPDYVRLLRRNWLFLVVASLLGVLVSAAVAYVSTPQYTSTARLYVSVPAQEASASTDLNQGNSFARQAVASFVDVADSQVVLQRAGRSLSPQVHPGELAAHVSASSPANTVLIDIAAVHPDPERAAAIANAVASAFTKTVTQELEKPSGGGESLIRISRIQEAEPSERPSAPRVPLLLGLGSAGGLVLGVVVAVLRTVLDTRIRTVAQLEAATERPFLGGLFHDPEATVRPLVVHRDPRSPKSEAFRRLRTSLQFLNVGGDQRSFVVTSSGPSEGKTYTATNLAVALAETGASVALVDADLRRPSVASNFQIEGGAGLSDILIGRAELDDVLQPWGERELAVLPSGPIPPNPSEMLGSVAMGALIEHLRSRFDHVIIDAPPMLLVADAAILSRFAGVLFVGAAGKVRRADVDSALRSLEGVGASVLGVVATLLPVRGPDADTYGNYAYYGDRAVDVPGLDVEERRLRRSPAP